MTITINDLKVGDVIKINPVKGTVVTAYSRPQKTENIGKVNAGEIYVIHKIDLDTGMIELENVSGHQWPANLHPVSWAGVWIDARFVLLVGSEPGTDPQPAGRFEAAVVAAVETFLRVYRGG